MIGLDEFELRIRDAERAFAEDLSDRIMWALFTDPNEFIGPPKPQMTRDDYANDPRYYLDLGFPHCWMPKMEFEEDVRTNPYRYYRGENKT